MTELENINNQYSTMLQYIDLIASHDNEKPSTADLYITEVLQTEQRNISKED